MPLPSRERLGPGALINGKFRLTKEIGAGGMGAVFLAEQLPLGRLVAVKVVHPHLGQNERPGSSSESGPEAFQKRFFREAQALSQLRHRNIVTVFDYGRIEGQDAFFMVMEYLDGQPLSAPLRGGGRLDERTVVDVLRQLARGLREVHQAGLVHRDLKPANVFLAREGDEPLCKLLDFGLVKQVRGPNVDPDDLTAAGTLLGSPIYMAPEQVDGGAVDARTDIYALGAVLYHCLAGKPPFEGSLTQVMIQHSHADPPPLAERTPGVEVSPALEHIVRRCLAKDPADRYADIDELFLDLSEVEIMHGLPPSGRRSGLSTPPLAGPIGTSSGSWPSQRSSVVGPGPTMPNVSRSDLLGATGSRAASGSGAPGALTPSSGSVAPGSRPSGSIAPGSRPSGSFGPGAVVAGSTPPVAYGPGVTSPGVIPAPILPSGAPGATPDSSRPGGEPGSLLQPGATTLSAAPRPADSGRRWAVLAGVGGALAVALVAVVALRRDPGTAAGRASVRAVSSVPVSEGARATLRLGSQPPGAQVLEGERLLGVTPLEVPIEEPGAGMSHRYELRLEGYEPFVVDQAPGRESVRLVVPLRPAVAAPTAPTAPTVRATGKTGGHSPAPPPTGAAGAATRSDPAIRMTRLRGSMLRRESRAAWLALALVVWTGLGRADDVADEAELYFKVGAEKFIAREYRGALEYFLRSNRLVPNRNVVFNIARSYELLGQLNDAFRYYTLALEGETDAAARRTVEAAQSALRSRVAVLEVETEPPGATVYIDRKDLGARGVAPRSLAFGAGTYRVLASLPGHADATPVEVKLELGKSTRVKLTLVRLVGTVIFEGAPAGSRARIDGADDVPLEGDRLVVPPGRHQVVLRAPGYQDDPHLVEIEADQTVRQPARLQPVLGSVVVETDERDAQILIDGRPVGFTPSVVAAPLGTHQLQLRLPGFREVRRTIEVSAGEPLRVEAELREVAEISAASRAVEAVSDAPSSVSVLTRQDLRAFGYPTIAEALRGLRGFYVGDSSSYASVGVRGFSRLGDYGQRVLVLLDGHPTNDDYIGSSYVGLDNRVDLEDIERIEVVRGPGSVVYGTNAFLGVVNLVPRQGRGRTGGEVGVSVFDHGLARGRARADVALGPNASAWVSVMGARGSGRDFTFPELAGADGSVPAATGADAVRAGSAQGEIRWRDLRVQGFYTSRNKNLPTGAYDTILGDRRTSLRDTRGFVEARYEPRLLDSLQLLTRLHANLYDFRGRYAYPAAEGNLGVETYEGRWYGGELRMLFTPSPKLRVMFGGEAQLHTSARLHGQDDTGVYLEDNQPFRVAGAYTSVDWSPLAAVRLSGGARLDYFSTFNGVSLNPRLAAILRPASRTVVKVIGSRAFRAPSIYEFYYQDNGRTQQPSLDLRPESIYSGEVEVTQQLAPTTTLAGSVFASSIQSLISPVGSGTDADPLVYKNSPSPVQVLGAEVELRRDWRQGWMVDLVGSVHRASYRTPDAVSPGLRDVPDSPRFLASARAAAPLLNRALTLASRLSLEGPRFDRFERDNDTPQGTTDTALLWDVILSGEDSRSGVSYSVGGYNLFDWRYRIPLSSEFRQRTLLQNGRTLLANVKVTF